jgi:hypothetical protein
LKHRIIRLLVLFILVIFNKSTFLNAQTETAAKTGKSIFKAKTSDLSNSVYNGRKDSLEVPYLNFSLKYLNSSGFYAGAGISYLVSSYAQRIDAFNINAGYFKEINDHFDFSVNLSKSLYNSNSVSVISEILGNVSGIISYTNDYFDLSAATFLSVTSSKPDLSFNLSASHSFSLDPDDQWSLEPTFDVNFGTRHYYGSYISTRQSKKGKGLISGGTTTSGNSKITIEKSVIALNTEKMALLDYEVSLPLYYRGPKWGFFFVPTYAIPQSPITYETTIITTVTANGNSVTNTRTNQSIEGLSNVFYGEIGVSYKF